MNPTHPLTTLSDSRAGIYLHQFLAAIGCSTVEQFFDVCQLLGVCDCANCSRTVACWLIPTDAQDPSGYPFCYDCFWDFINAQLAEANNDAGLRAECAKRFGDRAKLYTKCRLAN